MDAYVDLFLEALDIFKYLVTFFIMATRRCLALEEEN